MPGCGYARPESVVAAAFPKARRDRHSTDADERERFPRCLRCCRKMACRQWLRSRSANERCWQRRNWRLSTPKCRRRCESRNRCQELRTRVSNKSFHWGFRDGRSFARAHKLRQILAAVKAARYRLASLGLDRGSDLPENQRAGRRNKQTSTPREWENLSYPFLS